MGLKRTVSLRWFFRVPTIYALAEKQESDGLDCHLLSGCLSGDTGLHCVQ